MKHKKHIKFAILLSIILVMAMVLVSCDYRTNDVPGNESNSVIESIATPEPAITESTTVPITVSEPTVPPTPSIELDIPDYITIQGRQFSTELTYLNLMRWVLEDEDIKPLRYMINLTSLDLNHNPISDFSPIADLTNLTELRILDNTATDLTPLAGLTNLETLELSLRYFYDTDITPLKGLTNLTSFRLSLGGSQVSDVSRLAELTNLTRLDLWHNQIVDLTPLAGLTHLRYLDLSFNEVYDITPLANVTSLRDLALSFNEIYDITPIANLINLNALSLSYQSGMDLSLLYDIPMHVSPPVAPSVSDNPHPFANSLADFFVNLTTAAAEERFFGMPYSYHAVLVDVDGQGTMGVVASRWAFEGDRNYPFAFSNVISIHPSFSQRLFFIYDGDLYEVGGQQWGVTPSGRLVAVMRDGACDIAVTEYMLLSVSSGSLIGVKAVSIWDQTWGDNHYAVNYHINEFLWRDREQDQSLAYDEFNEIMNRYGLYGTTTNLWELSDDTYRILEMSDLL